MSEIRNVVIFSSEFPPSPGGIGNHAFCLSKYLNMKGVLTSVVTIGEKAQEHDRLLPFRIYRYKNTSRFFKIIYLLKKVKEFNREFDVIVASGLTMLLVLGFFLLYSKRRSRFVAIAHGLDINYNSWIVKQSVRFLLKKFNVIIPVSSYTASYLPGQLAKKITVINNGFDSERFSNPNKDFQIAGYPSLITVGRVTDRKGQINVIKSLPYLIKFFPALHYHMIGIPEQQENYLKIANQLGVGKHVTFHGVKSDQEVSDFLANSDIFVMLSQNTLDGDFEGFGIAIMEANSLGTPSIGSKGCGIEDAIEDGVSGFLIDSQSYKQILISIGKILDNYEEFSKGAIDFSNKFKWDIVVEKYIDVLNEKDHE